MAIEVMIVDDSAVMRQTLSEVLNAAPDIRVIHTAADPIVAERHLQSFTPDVLVLDIEMPRMDGLTFLQHIMQRAPIPVVICSSLTSKGCELSLQALSAGAVEVIAKPTTGLKQFLLDAQSTFWRAVRVAAQARLQPKYAAPVNTAAMPKGAELVRASGTTDQVIAIGTSTGGTQALEQVLAVLPRTAPGIVVVQHMPEKFTSAFAKRLNSISAIEVIEAQGGERIIPGRAFIAPGGHHLEVQRSGAQFMTHVFRGPAVNRHCPSVDVLFNSVAKQVGRSATGIIMTGMGSDGARGLLHMREAGANTIAQDQASSVVFGMPKEAIDLGAAQTIIGLDQIANAIINSAARH